MQIARRENGSISAMYGFCKLSSLKIDSKWCAWEEGVRKGKGRGGEDRQGGGGKDKRGGEEIKGQRGGANEEREMKGENKRWGRQKEKNRRQKREIKFVCERGK